MFPAGLIFVLLAGADLFTGNILIALAAFQKKVTWGQAAKNWALVWLGNLLGAIVVAWMVGQAGVFDWSNGLYGGVVLKTAIGKVGIEFMPALISGILCNWVVCVTVWITYASKDVAGKVLTGFIGIFFAIVVAWMVGQAGVFDWSNGLYGGVVLKTAIGKVGIEFMPALISGILCNWVVCVTVWITYASKDVAGKVLTGFIGIFLFVCTGFEHCVANMGYLFAAFFSKANPMYLEAAHKTAADAASINFKGMFINNLLPVTIGNILGGLVFVAGLYFFLFVNKEDAKKEAKNA